MSLIIQSPEKQWLDLFENLSLHNAFFIDSVLIILSTQCITL